MAKDVSNKAVVILLLVAIIISVVGTWSVMKSAQITGYATNVAVQGKMMVLSGFLIAIIIVLIVLFLLVYFNKKTS